MFSYKTQWIIQRILPFGIIWVILGIVFLLVEHAAIDTLGPLPTEAVRLDLKIFIFAMIAVFFVGILIGTLEYVYLDKLFSRLSFGRKLLAKILVYGVIFFLIILVNYPIATSMEYDVGILDPFVWDRYLNFLTSIPFITTIFQMGVSLVASLLYAEISSNIGHSTLINFFTGKYHKPREEERVYMFIDMRSSTTIAESLGNLDYFNLLKEFYAVLSDPIIEYGGQIMEYVGDEIVISWPMKKGVQQNACIRCFFAMKEGLAGHGQSFQNRFGLIPSFKAGLHCGSATIGEIGTVKKEIAYTGDVLNTTARIQGLCNTFQTDILLSEDLLKKLTLNTEYIVESIGKTNLKGRKEDVNLYTISLANKP